jgi:hypothetical protein
LTGYAFVTFRSVGDQPGKRTFRYLTDWKTLPEGVFIPEAKFKQRTAVPNYSFSDLAAGKDFQVFGFTNCFLPAFPKDDSTASISLPCIAFDYQGRLISQPPNQDYEYIPLAQGSVAYARDPQTRRVKLGTADGEERPPLNSIDGYHMVRIDRLTGRAHLERKAYQ